MFVQCGELTTTHLRCPRQISIVTVWIQLMTILICGLIEPMLLANVNNVSLTIVLKKKRERLQWRAWLRIHFRAWARFLPNISQVLMHIPIWKTSLATSITRRTWDFGLRKAICKKPTRFAKTGQRTSWSPQIIAWTPWRWSQAQESATQMQARSKPSMLFRRSMMTTMFVQCGELTTTHLRCPRQISIVTVWIQLMTILICGLIEPMLLANVNNVSLTIVLKKKKRKFAFVIGTVMLEIALGLQILNTGSTAIVRLFQTGMEVSPKHISAKGI